MLCMKQSFTGNRELKGIPRNAEFTRHSKSMGVTLVEILVVVAIVAVLAAILLPVYSRAKWSAYDTTNISNLKQIGLAGAMYADTHQIKAPLSLHPLVDEGSIPLNIIVSPNDGFTLGQGGYLREKVHVQTGSVGPKRYRFSYWGREELGINYKNIDRSEPYYQLGQNRGWLLYFRETKTDSSFIKDGAPYFRLLIEGSVVKRVAVAYPLKGDSSGRTFLNNQSFFADFSADDVYLLFERG